MATRTDIILDADGDFPEANNTPISYSDRQHVADAFMSHSGWWKENPTYGISIQKYLKSRSSSLIILNKIAREQLNKDGYYLGSVPFNLNLSTNTLSLYMNNITRI